VILKPTLDVEVAVALMFNPAIVVVPKPSVETERRDLVVEPTAKPMRSPPKVLTANLAVGVVVPTPIKPFPVTMKCVADDDPITNSGTPDPRALGLTEN
jgi:hypothetical protein